MCTRVQRPKAPQTLVLPKRVEKDSVWSTQAPPGDRRTDIWLAFRKGNLDLHPKHLKLSVLVVEFSL